MSTLDPRAQAIISAFGTQPGVTPDQMTNLQAAINASPALIDQINDAVAHGHLKGILPLTNPHAGGEYQPTTQTMYLPLARLTTPPAGIQQADQFRSNMGEITFVFGHELQHGFTRDATAKAFTDFAGDVRRIAKQDAGPRDYTTTVATLLAQNRRDEATAEIAGWNAIVSRVKTASPSPTLQEIFEAQPGRIRDFIDRSNSGPPYTYALKLNLVLNADMTLDPTPGNVEAMGQNYFDKPARNPGGLGALGNSDYANYYAASELSFIAQTERHYHAPQPGALPQMGLDLARLRLNEQLLEENGIDLGKQQQPLPYLDLGRQPPAAGLFQHTKATHQHVSPIGIDILRAELAKERVEPAPTRNPADPDHPDHAMFEKIREGVRKLDRAAGKDWDEASDRLSASALLMARQKGFSAHDDLQLAFNTPTERHAAGEILHLFRQGPGASPDPAANRVHIATADALSAPSQDRWQQVEAIAQSQFQQQQQSHLTGVETPARSNLVR